MQAAIDQMRPLLHGGVDVSSLQPSVIQAISLKMSIVLYNPCALQKLVNVSIEDGVSLAAQTPDYDAILVSLLHLPAAHKTCTLVVKH